MRTVRVFKTNVDSRSKARTILDEIRRHLPVNDLSIDLEDCDKVLRVETLNGGKDDEKIKHIVKEQGFKIDNLL